DQPVRGTEPRYQPAEDLLLGPPLVIPAVPVRAVVVVVRVVVRDLPQHRAPPIGSDGRKTPSSGKTLAARGVRSRTPRRSRSRLLQQFQGALGIRARSQQGDRLVDGADQGAQLAGRLGLRFELAGLCPV